MPSSGYAKRLADREMFVPDPDDLGSEIIHIADGYVMMFRYPRPFLVSADEEDFFIEDGVLYQTFPYDRNNVYDGPID